MPESPDGKDVTVPGSSPDAGEGPVRDAGTTPESSAGKPAGEGEPTTALDAVMSAVKKGEDAKKTAAKGADPPTLTDGKPPEGEGKGKEGEPGQGKRDGELGKAGQERIRELVRENKGLKQKAQYFDQMNEFAVNNGLSHQEISYALNLIRLVKNDPARAVAQLTPLVNRVRQFTGDAMPQDLADSVASGQLTEAHAREIAAARAREHHRGEADRRRAAEEAAQRQRDEQGRYAQAVGRAVSEWERTWKASDPDYGKKQRWVAAEIQRRMAEDGSDLTPEEAVALAKEALETVEADLKGIAPSPQGIRTPTGGGGRNHLPEPKTAVEAAERALEASRAGA